MIRFAMVMVLFPAFSRIGYGFTWRECTALSWGGLRGAVDLASAMDTDIKISIDRAIKEPIILKAAALAQIPRLTYCLHDTDLIWSSLFGLRSTKQCLIQSVGLARNHYIRCGHSYTVLLVLVDVWSPRLL